MKRHTPTPFSTARDYRPGLRITWLLWLWWWLLPLSATSFAGDAPLVFSHPVSSEPYYLYRDRYFNKVLELALQKSGVAYQIKPVPLPPMLESRSEIYLTKGRYNTHWLMTNNSHEDKLIPIRIPLYKGLIGWRLLLIHPDSQQQFATIDSVRQLRTLTAVQGLDWPDSSILKSSGFNLRTSLQWTSLVELIALRRADYFPRSVIEIWEEQERTQRRSLMVEEHLVLHYPSAYYFFVSRLFPHHAEVLEQGLRKAVEDGSFDALFQQNFGESLARANLQQRRVISINNPLLPPHTPLKDSQLWYRVEPTPSPKAANPD